MLLLWIWLINKTSITVSNRFESRVEMTGDQMQDKLKERKVKKSSNSVLMAYLFFSLSCTSRTSTWSVDEVSSNV